MKKIVFLILTMTAFAVSAGQPKYQQPKVQLKSESTAVGVGIGVSKANAYSNAVSKSNAYSNSKSSANAQGGKAVAAGFGGNSASFSKGGNGGSGGTASVNGSGGSASAGGANVSFQGEKYPNQAPPIFTTSAPSFSQRNCTPVGSVNASGPFGGLGIAFPMGGATCDGLNTADKLADWERESGDLKLWLVQCNLMVVANDDLAEAFENSGYSCQDAYIKRQAEANSRAKMTALQER
jgi:hypothetical protein